MTAGQNDEKRRLVKIVLALRENWCEGSAEARKATASGNPLEAGHQGTNKKEYLQKRRPARCDTRAAVAKKGCYIPINLRPKLKKRLRRKKATPRVVLNVTERDNPDFQEAEGKESDKTPGKAPP